MSDRLQSATDFRELLQGGTDDSPYDYAGIFCDRGWIARRLSRRKLKLLKRVDPVLRPMLHPGERVLFVTWGIAVSFWESYFLGWALLLMNRRALVVTTERILLVQINSRDVPRDLRSQIRYGAIRKLSLTMLGNVKIKFRDGSAKVFSHVPKRDRRFLKQLVDQVSAGVGDAAADAESMEELCPHCFEPAELGDRACSACGRGFKSPAKAGWLSLLFPGFGDLYIGHRGFAALEIIVAAIFWLAFLATAADPSMGPVEAAVVVAIVFVFIHGIDAVATWLIARKGIHPERGTPPGAAVFLGAALPLAAAIIVVTAIGVGKRGLAPAPVAVTGSELTPRQLDVLREAGFMQADDDIVYFYSNGPSTVLQDGNFFTRERVVSYARDTESVFHKSATFAEVAYLQVDPASEPDGLTRIYVVPEAGESFYLIVSPTQGGDTLFAGALVERWRAMRLREPSAGIWFDGGPATTSADPIVIRGATAAQVEAAEMWLLARWFGQEGEDWRYLRRERLAAAGRRIDRVTIEFEGGEQGEYHFDVTEAVARRGRS